MYCEFFGFKENPFKITPDPRFVFLSKNHQEAFAHLLYGIQQHSGFIEIIGEVGSGKTTILRTLLNQLDDQLYRTALIFNPCLSAQELLASINREYGIPSDNLTIAMLLNELNRFLLQENSAGRTVVLVIDEAQNLDPHVLEQVRLISNLETESDKLIQIVLAGQPELGKLLDDPRLRQLSQRITVRYQLLPMDYDDTCAYIAHRMELAGGWKAASFEQAALKKIYAFSGGLPRLINVACDRALLVAFTHESRTITRNMAVEAIGEVGKRNHGLSRRPWRRSAAIALALGVAALIVIYGMTRTNDHSEGKPSAAVSKASSPISPGPVSATSPPTRMLPASSLGAAFRGTSEKDSGIEAFNSLAAKWQVRPVRTFTGTLTEGNLRRMARKRGLQLTQVTGTVDQMLEYDVPLILQVNLPGTQEVRYVAVTSRRGAGLVCDPAVPSLPVIPESALQQLSTGRGYLLWKNFLNIPTTSEEAKGEPVRLLQQLLQKTGSYGGRLNGKYDKDTVEALKRFQTYRKLPVDGKVSDRALVLLYRDAGEFPVPRLKGKTTGEAA